jgi:hypothetical protein
MPIIKELSKVDNRYQVSEGDTITAKATTFKKAQYHAAIVGACNEQYQKNHRSSKAQYHTAILKAIDSTREQLASRLPGAHLPANPGAGKLALQKLAQEERDREKHRLELGTPLKMGGPSSGSGISAAEREGRLRFLKWIEARQKHVSKKTAKKSQNFYAPLAKPPKKQGVLHLKYKWVDSKPKG